MITVIVVFAVLGLMQEHHAARALEALARMAAASARVIRDGLEQVVPARGGGGGSRAACGERGEPALLAPGSDASPL